jgi:hypothetical protein
MADYIQDNMLSVAMNSDDKRVGILIFASHKNFGGGYKRHSNAQEEYIFNRTTLSEYDTKKTMPKEAKRFYPLHHSDADGFVLTAQIKKDNQKREFYFIFVPAPVWNLKSDPRKSKTEVLRARAKIIYDLASEYNIDHLILGGWGCGVFGCPPRLVAATLAEFAPKDIKITYAFLDQKIMKMFQEVQENM